MATNNSRLWVLGAADPEMQAIESLLSSAGERVAYATINGIRVHPGNAYKSDGLSCGVWGHLRNMTPQEIAAEAANRAMIAKVKQEMGGVAAAHFAAHDATLVLVECDFKTEFRAADPSWFADERRVDHHRPGDPGYGKPPHNYMAASSLGQVLLLMGHELHECGNIGREGEWRWGSATDSIGTVPDDAELIAAADHCLESAYRGKCPGVDPDELMRWRAESRAAFQKRPAAEVLADVEAARLILRKAIGDPLPWMVPGAVGDLIPPFTAPGADDPDWWVYTEDGGAMAPLMPLPYAIRRAFADLRGQQVPELPEAAAREGIAFLSTVKDRDGREKVVIMAAPPNLVERFLAGEIVTDLTDMYDIYGDPARGFAGGYLSEK